MAEITKKNGRYESAALAEPLNNGDPVAKMQVIPWLAEFFPQQPCKRSKHSWPS